MMSSAALALIGSLLLSKSFTKSLGGLAYVGFQAVQGSL